MNNLVLKRIIESKKTFVPYLFTDKQIRIIRKKIRNAMLTNAENKQWYSSIKQKIMAIETIAKRPVYVNFGRIIPERLEKAVELLDDISEDAFISGSYLYGREYGDIDIFIVSKKRDEKKEGNIHYTFITKKALFNPIIQSAARASVSNFPISRDYDKPKMSIFDYINLFQETALLIMQGKDDKKEVRDIIFHYLTLKDNDIPDSLLLYEKIKEFGVLNENLKLKELKSIFKGILTKYKKSYLKKELLPYSGLIDEDIASSKLNEHLKYYKNAFDEVLSA